MIQNSRTPDIVFTFSSEYFNQMKKLQLGVAIDITTNETKSYHGKVVIDTEHKEISSTPLNQQNEQ